MRTLFFGRAVVSGMLAVLALAACGDDANDQGVAARQLAARVEGARLDAGTPDVPDTTPPDTTSPDTTPPGLVASADDQAASDDDTASPATTEPTQRAVEPTGVLVPVIALDNSFRPEVIEVAVGDEVVWENRGANEHNVLMVQDSAAPFGVEVADFQPGDIYAHVFTEPGEFHYYCSIHGNETVGMVGTVVVTG